MNIIGKPLYWLNEWMLSFRYFCCLSWLKLSSIPKILSHNMNSSTESITGNSGTWYRHIRLSTWIKEY
ncbi:hypothetical protein OAD78_06160 [Candidatus Thioglobus sp.]|nr:hypothetical protein [Candidatus Thioglobus sp.]